MYKVLLKAWIPLSRLLLAAQFFCAIILHSRDSPCGACSMFEYCPAWGDDKMVLAAEYRRPRSAA